MVNSSIFASSFSASVINTADFFVTIDHNSYFAIVAETGCSFIVLPDLNLGTTILQNNSRVQLVKNNTVDPITIICGGTSTFDNGSTTYPINPQNWAVFHGNNEINQWNVYHSIGSTAGFGISYNYSPLAVEIGTPVDPGSGNIAFNDSVPAGITGMAISYTDAVGLSFVTVLNNLIARNGIIYLPYGGNYIVFRVLEVAGAFGTYAHIRLQYLGGVLPAAGQNVSLIPTIGSVEAQSYATITNLDTDPPTISNAVNFEDLVCWRIGTGEYGISLTGMFTDYTHISINVQGATPHSYSTADTTTDTRTIYVCGPTGVRADPVGIKIMIKTPDV